VNYKKLLNDNLVSDIKDFDKLKNKKIVDIGFVKGAGVEGGLCIDYEDLEKITTTRRMVLGFTELGMWVEYDGEKGNCSEFILREKIEKFYNFISDREGWKFVKIENNKDNMVLKYKNKKLELNSAELKIIENKIPKVKEIFSLGKKDIKNVMAFFFNFINWPHYQVSPDFFKGYDV
jgi:hypothetical protein